MYLELVCLLKLYTIYSKFSVSIKGISKSFSFNFPPPLYATTSLLIYITEKVDLSRVSEILQDKVQEIWGTFGTQKIYNVTLFCSSKMKPVANNFITHLLLLQQMCYRITCGCFHKKKKSKTTET